MLITIDCRFITMNLVEAKRGAADAIPKGHTVNCRPRSEEHTSELQSRLHLVCRLLLEKKKKVTVRQSTDDRDHRSLLYTQHQYRENDREYRDPTVSLSLQSTLAPFGKSTPYLIYAGLR